jgi:hypothetical protein
MKNSSSFAPLLTRPYLREEIDCELATRSLKEFVRQAWAIVEPSTPFVPGWHIDAIVEHLEAVTSGQIRNLLINVPPRHMKSLLVSVFWPAWEWIRWPERRWLYSSYGAQLSIRDSVQCRRLIESPWYQARWGDRFALTSDQNTKGRFDNDRSGYRLSTSVGGAVTGEGGDRIVCDDPNNVNEVESDSVRKTVQRLVRRGDVNPRERSEDCPTYRAKSTGSNSGRISISESTSIGFGQRLSHSTASSIDLTSHIQ